MCLVAQSCLALCNPIDCGPPGSSVHGDSPGNNTEVHCHALLQGIFPSQGSNPGLLHCTDSLQSEPPGKPCLGVCSQNTVFKTFLNYAFFLFQHGYVIHLKYSQACLCMYFILGISPIFYYCCCCCCYYYLST